MAGLESYSNLSKQPEDLLKKGFCFSQLSSFTLYTRIPQGINQKSSIKLLNDNSVLSSSNLHYKSSQFSFKPEFYSTNTIKATLELTPEKLKDLKFKIEAELADSNKSTFSVEYSNSLTRSKLAINHAKSLKLSTVVQVQEGKGLGLELAADTVPLKLLNYNATFWWHKSDFQAILRYANKENSLFDLKNFKLLGVYKWCPKSKVAFSYSSADHPEVKLGFEYSPEVGKVLKGRFDNDANLGLSLRTRLSSLFTLTVASQFNLLDNDLARFGFRLKVNQ